MSIAAWEIAPQTALIDYSKEAVGKGQCRRFWLREVKCNQVPTLQNVFC